MTYEERISAYLKELPSIVRDYYSAELEGNKALSTATTYLTRLSIFFKHYNNADDFYVRLMPNDLQSFIETLECGQKNKALMWSVLNSFYSYLESQNLILKNPMHRVEREKCDAFTVQSELSCRDAFEIYDGVRNSNKKWKNRDYAMLMLVICNGIKAGSLVEIDVDDYDNDTHILTVDSKEYLIFGHARKALEAWLEEREETYGYVEDDALFISSYKQRISTEAFRKIISNNLDEDNYDNVKMEDLRKVMARGLLNIGVSISTIQKYLGHKDARQTYALLDSVQQTSGSIKEDDEDAILNIYGCSSVSDLEKMLNGIYLPSDTKHDFRMIDEHSTGTKVYQKPIDDSTDIELFNKAWFNKDAIYEYCSSETQNNALVWVDFDMFEDAGVRLSPVVFDHMFDYSLIEDIHIYAAQFDLEKYFEYKHIADTSLILESYYYYFFYAVGYIDGEKVSALRVLVKDKAVNQNLSAYEFALCSESKAVEFHNAILANLDSIEALRENSDPMNETKAKSMAAFCKARITILEFIKSFEGSEPLHDTLDEQIENVKNVDNMISKYLLFSALQGLADVVKGFAGNSDEDEETEDDAGDEDDVEFEILGEQQTLLDSDKFKVYFKRVRLYKDDESARVIFVVFNNTSEPINVWLTDLTLDGEEYEDSYYQIGTLDSYGDGFLYLPLTDISCDTYYDLSFVVDISDKDNKTVEKTKTIEMRIDFDDMEVSFKNTDSSNYSEDSNEDDEEDEDEDILEDYEPFGVRTPLLQNGDYSVYFEEVQVNDDDESASVCFEIYNHTNKSIHPWITRLTVDGNPAAKEYNNLGTVEIYDNKYLYLELNDISTDTYYDFSFVVDVSDENNHSIVTTNTISVRIDFEDHTVKFDSIPTNLKYATNDEDEAEEDDEYCEFEDISFDILNNSSYQVQYMNPEVDGNDVSLSFYIRNDTDEEITVWAHNVYENGNLQEDSFMNLGTVAPNETEILSLSLNDIEDGDNGDVELSIEIDRDTSEKIFETDRVRIDIDFDNVESSAEVISSSMSVSSRTGNEIEKDQDENCSISSDFVIEGTTLTKYNGKNSRVVVPEGITEIADGVFKWQREIKEIVLPETLVSVGCESICCFSLERINIPANLTNISEGAFFNAKEIKYIDIHPDNRNYVIYKGAFIDVIRKTLIHFSRHLNDCVDLNLPESNLYNKIGKYACSSLYDATAYLHFPEDYYYAEDHSTYKYQTLFIPNCVKEIGDFAFRHCSGLKKAYIPESVEKIGLNPFFGCYELSVIQVSKDNMFFTSECNCLINVRERTLIAGSPKNDISGIKSCDTIYAYAFAEISVANIYMIPRCIKKICQKAFFNTYTKDYDAIKGFFIPSTVQYIEEQSFYSWSGVIEHVYCEASQKPVGWHDNWNDEKQSGVKKIHWNTSVASYTNMVRQKNIY